MKENLNFLSTLLLLLFCSCSPDTGQSIQKDEINDCIVREKNDFKKTKNACRTACDKGNATACYRWGRILVNPNYGKVDSKKARMAYVKACTGERKASDQGIGCYYLAEFFEKGMGGPIDEKKAAEYYLKSCEQGYGGGCIRAAMRICYEDIKKGDGLIKRSRELNYMRELNIKECTDFTTSP